MASAELRRTQSSGMLKKSGELALAGSASQGALTKHSPPPKVPKYLSVHALTRRRKLAASTGNLHGYMAEDYHQINWPLPKMFGKEKYGYSLIDITDPRHLKESASMSKKLVRLQYDQQIIDLEWRKTYKSLLDAEHRRDTLPGNAQPKTKDMHKKEVDDYIKYLGELQEQKDMYEKSITEVYTKCDDIKLALKKESDLEDLRVFMETRTKDSLSADNAFFRTKFNIHASGGRGSGM
eukprot:CAMPEP_0203961090 /NCGR_PEP_ID=MMETSP0359-20131031/91621_1 /ASSEMBLY_ACC=CAM_ASM_000338 /TAXON_ID=268821 /ORGANISM="Scrippsiella Hangoei, Strain SHTV-5" /LENGTH=236 /DNA_ID=CAMNT_0050895747 /DNA_START=63 /DNA_END=773 /DNA_ORIENTATION=+